MPAKTRNILLVLEYDGAAFYGFQRQPGRPTVQQALEDALSRLFDRKVKITAASGRTDTGVHAEGQAVNFKINSSLELSVLQKALNGLLPKQIAVREVKEMPSGFHARYHAASKLYEYRIWNHAVRSPLRAKTCCHIPYRLHLARMRKAAAYLKGRHDFRSFCAADPARREGRNTVRTIRCLEVKKEGSLIRIMIEADGFLYRMVRNLAGMLVEAGAGRLPVSDVPRILAARNRKLAARTMPPEGLRLVKVTYAEA